MCWSLAGVYLSKESARLCHLRLSLLNVSKNLTREEASRVTVRFGSKGVVLCHDPGWHQALNTHDGHETGFLTRQILQTFKSDNLR